AGTERLVRRLAPKWRRRGPLLWLVPQLQKLVRAKQQQSWTTYACSANMAENSQLSSSCQALLQSCASLDLRPECAIQALSGTRSGGCHVPRQYKNQRAVFSPARRSRKYFLTASSGMGNTVTASGPRRRLQSSGNSAHCSPSLPKLVAHSSATPPLRLRTE